MLSERLLIKGR